MAASSASTKRRWWRRQTPMGGRSDLATGAREGRRDLGERTAAKRAERGTRQRKSLGRRHARRRSSALAIRTCGPALSRTTALDSDYRLSREPPKEINLIRERAAMQITPIAVPFHSLATKRPLR